ncbi:MAG: hypothetical protein C4519_08620 [Desulfobacteraceae bacterium]|nr:MAG: hypothetical protein C4519_08620 [Desulfobacteraceae bacterium]
MALKTTLWNKTLVQSQGRAYLLWNKAIAPAYCLRAKRLYLTKQKTFSTRHPRRVQRKEPNQEPPCAA